MVKKNIKNYRIQKKFEIWVEKGITALNMEAALEIAKASKLEDFIEINKDVDLLDSTLLNGTGVYEWED